MIVVTGFSTPGPPRTCCCTLVQGTRTGARRAPSWAAQSALYFAPEVFGMPASIVVVAGGAIAKLGQFALSSRDRFLMFARSQLNSDRPTPVTLGAAKAGAGGRFDSGMTGGAIAGAFGWMKAGLIAGGGASLGFDTENESAISFSGGVSL